MMGLKLMLRWELCAAIILIVLPLSALCNEEPCCNIGARDFMNLSWTPAATAQNESFDIFALGEEIDRQCMQLENKDICDVTDPNSLPRCIRFLDDYETQLRDQALLLDSFEELIFEQWPSLSEEERIELTASLEDLLRRQSNLLFRFQLYMKRLWCLLDAKDKKKFIDSYEDLLKRQSGLLLGFEDLLHWQQQIRDSKMFDFLSSFEDLIRRQAILLDTFSDFLSVNCHALKISKTIQPSCACVRPGQQVTYYYTISNTENYTVKCIKIIDDRLGVIAEGITLGPYESRSFSKQIVIDEPVGTVICNQARVYGIDPKGFTISAQSKRICIRVMSAAANIDSITTGRQRSLAFSTDPASASNSIEIKKNQKRNCLSNLDSASREMIKIADQSAAAFNNAKASNSIKMMSDHN